MIDPDRLFGRLQKLGEIGRSPQGGVSRLALTELDRQGLALIESWMIEAGLHTRMDAAGNLIGRREGRQPHLPVVLTGSHSDTTQDGGMFDGALGILGGIEALQSMAEDGVMTDHPIEVCAYRDEEGCRFAASYSSSRVMTGKFNPQRLQYRDENGISIAQALREQNINPDTVGQAARAADSVKAHIELHIEQGNVLESQNLAVGIVSGICAASRSRMTLTGQARHAGTTPMSMRRDALVAAAAVIQMVEKEAQRRPGSVATVGVIRAFPGGVNVIPGKVELSLDCRDIDTRQRDELLDDIIRRAQEICAGHHIEFAVTTFGKGQAKLCDEAVKDAIAQACGQLDMPTMLIASGAGHDSGSFHDFCPMGMIFVRSREGISHHPDEWSSPEDCADGVRVLYHSLLKLAECS